MKRIFFTLFLLLCICMSSYAQRFRFGIRAGVNLVDYSMGNAVFTRGSVLHGNTKAGFETALVGRLNITRHLHLQTEFEFSRTGYGFLYSESGVGRRDVKIHANRIEIPLEIGLNAGPVRLFGGVAFRVAHSEKSNAPTLLKVKFNDSDVGIMGGVGVNIRRFFIDARITGYPKASTANMMTSHGETKRVSVGRHIRWSLSAGFLF